TQLVCKIFSQGCPPRLPASFRNNRCNQLLPECEMRYRKCYGFRDVRMRHQRIVHFGRVDGQPAPFHEFLCSPDNEEVSVSVHVPDIAGTQPTVEKCLPIPTGIFCNSTGAPAANLSGLTCNTVTPVFVGDPNLRPETHASRASLTLSGWKRIGADHRCG